MGDRAMFHLQLITNLIDMAKYPLTKLMIEKDLSESEYHDFMRLMKDLNELYEQQKAEGLLDFSSLLIQFVGMLNPKLDPNQTIVALKKEAYYPELMDEFLFYIHQQPPE